MLAAKMSTSKILLAKIADIHKHTSCPPLTYLPMFSKDPVSYNLLFSERISKNEITQEASFQTFFFFHKEAV